MKKIVALCVVALLTLSFYTYKISMDLYATRKIKAMEIVELMNPPTESYAALETLPEPGDMKDADVLERIRMLRDHLSCNPSPEWVGEVIEQSELEIERLRSGRQ